MSEHRPELVNDRAGEAQLPSTTKQSVALAGLTGYINAGGRGTRLRAVFQPHERRGVSKALLTVGRPPIPLIEHQINKLAHAGVSTIVAGVGDHDNVAQHVRTVYNGRPGIHAIYYHDQLDNGGDLVRAIRERPELFADNVLITNVDTLLDIDEGNFLAFHRDRGGDLSIALTLNRGVPNEDAYYVGSDDEVIFCAEANRNDIPIEVAVEKCAYRGSSTGALIASRDMLSGLAWEPEDGPLPLYREVVAYALERGSMFAYNNGQRLFTDIGTVATWAEAQANHDTIAPYIHYAS
jgi:NDP-sugar pyrophosphorylase family protein